jgi:hypothetical protein
MNMDIFKRYLWLNIYKKGTSDSKRLSHTRNFVILDKNINRNDLFVINDFRKEMSFSFMSWSMIEKIKSKDINIQELAKSFVKELSVTLLPNHQSILHHLIHYEQMCAFFNEMGDKQSAAQTFGKQLEEYIPTEIPYLPDINGTTPLHTSIKMNNSRVTDKLVTFLSTTDFDHHSRVIMRKIPKLVEQVPMAMNNYLDKRLKITPWISNYTRGKVENVDDCDFNMAAADIWSPDIDD